MKMLSSNQFLKASQMEKTYFWGKFLKMQLKICDRFFSILLKFYYYLGIFLGIFVFQMKKGKSRLSNRWFLKVYSVFIAVFQLLICVPFFYVNYFMFLVQFMNENDKEMLKLVIDLHLAGVILSFCALMTSLYFDKIKISDLVEELLDLKKVLIDSNNFELPKKTYKGLIIVKTLFLDTLPLVSVILKCIGVFQVYNEPKAFSLFAFAFFHLFTNLGQHLISITHLYCTYLNKILNVKLIGMLEMLTNLQLKFSTESLYQDINEILIFHEKITRFVCKLTKFSGLFTTAFIISNFVSIVSQFFSNFALNSSHIPAIYFTNFILLVNCIFQVFFIIYASNQVTETNSETLEITRNLYKVTTERNAEERVSFSKFSPLFIDGNFLLFLSLKLESYIIKLLTYKVEIQPMRLFTINNSLINDVSYWKRQQN